MSSCPSIPYPTLVVESMRTTVVGPAFSSPDLDDDGDEDDDGDGDEDDDGDADED